MCRNGVASTDNLFRRFVVDKISVPKPVGSNPVYPDAIKITLKDIFKGYESDQLYEQFLHLHRSLAVGSKSRTVTIDIRKFAMNRVSCNVLFCFYFADDCAGVFYRF